jgi:hypothetical protein
VLFFSLVVYFAAPTVRAAWADSMNDPVVVESYAGARPTAADRILEPLRVVLQERGFVVDPTVLAMRLEASATRPGLLDESVTESKLSQMFSNGMRAWGSGDEKEALDKLEEAISASMRNPSLLSRASGLRKQLFRGYLLLALAQRRGGLGPASEATMRELIRTFPDRPIDLDEAGPEAHELYQFVVSDLAKSQPGALTVQVSDPSSVVFINEVLRRSGSRNVSLQGLLPGTYRVLVRSLDISDRVRVFNVPVYPSQRTILNVDWELDSVLVVDKWVGFRFGTTNEQGNEAAAARKLGVRAKSFVVVTLNLIRTRSAYRLMAKRYDTRTATLLAWCQVDLAGPDRRALALLAECAAGDDNRARVHTDPPAEAAALSRFYSSLKVEPLEPPAVEIRSEISMTRSAPPKQGGAGKWVWGAAGLVGLAAGGTLLYLHGRGSCDGPPRECATTYDTRTAGLVLFGAGTASLGISTVLFLMELDAPARSQPVSVGSPRKPWVAGVSLRW